MKLKTIEILCCPFDKADLHLEIKKQNQDDVIEGYLQCGSCNRVYPIISGIPIMNPDEYREFVLEKPVFEKWKIEVDPSFKSIEVSKNTRKDLSFDAK